MELSRILNSNTQSLQDYTTSPPAPLSFVQSPSFMDGTIDPANAKATSWITEALEGYTASNEYDECRKRIAAAMESGKVLIPRKKNARTAQHITKDCESSEEVLARQIGQVLRRPMYEIADQAIMRIVTDRKPLEIKLDKETRNHAKTRARLEKELGLHSWTKTQLAKHIPRSEETTSSSCPRCGRDDLLNSDQIALHLSSDHCISRHDFKVIYARVILHCEEPEVSSVIDEFDEAFHYPSTPELEQREDPLSVLTRHSLVIGSMAAVAWTRWMGTTLPMLTNLCVQLDAYFDQPRLPPPTLQQAIKRRRDTSYERESQLSSKRVRTEA